MKTNTKTAKPVVLNHEGTKVQRINALQQLRRMVLASLLWEDGYYLNGKSQMDIVSDLIPQVKPEDVASLAIEARNEQHLRHIPLFLVREMARPVYAARVHSVGECPTSRIPHEPQAERSG